MSSGSGASMCVRLAAPQGRTAVASECLGPVPPLWPPEAVGASPQRARRPPVDESAIVAEFARFADNESPELILEDGISAFCDELGIDPSDIVILVIAYNMEAAEMCVFTKEEFVRGMTKLRCVTPAHAAQPRSSDGWRRPLTRGRSLQGGLSERAEGQASRAARQAGRPRLLPRPCTASPLPIFLPPGGRGRRGGACGASQSPSRHSPHSRFPPSPRTFTSSRSSTRGKRARRICLATLRWPCGRCCWKAGRRCSTSGSTSSRCDAAPAWGMSTADTGR